MTPTNGKREQAAFSSLKPSQKTAQKTLLIAWTVVLLVFPISFSLGSNGTTDIPSSSNVAESAMDREMAEMVKLYRMCLQKHEDSPNKAKENCSMYKDAIREFSPTNLRTFVAELLDGLRDNCEKPASRRDKAF